MLMMYHSMFFFFKQKTAYEMRISDWSSGVCSSDLVHNACGAVAAVEGALRPLQDLDAFDIEERRREEDVRGLIDIVDVHRDRGAAVRAVIVLAADAADADRRRCHAAEIRCDAHAGDLRRQILEDRKSTRLNSSP